jgi:hypothetical protein
MQKGEHGRKLVNDGSEDQDQIRNCWVLQDHSIAVRADSAARSCGGAYRDRDLELSREAWETSNTPVVVVTWQSANV